MVQKSCAVQCFINVKHERNDKYDPDMYFFTVLSNTLMYKNVIQMVKTASAIVVSCAWSIINLLSNGNELLNK